MTSTSITNFRKNLFEYVRSAIAYNDVIDVTTKDGSAVVMSKSDYDAMMETLYLLSHPKTVAEVLEAKDQPNEAFVPLDRVAW